MKREYDYRGKIKCLRCKKKRPIHAKGYCDCCYNYLKIKEKKEKCHK